MSNQETQESSIPENTNQPAQTNYVPEKEHYETLLKLFRNLLWAITIIASVAAVLIGTGVNSIKSDINKELDGLRSKVAEIENKAEMTMDETKNEADKQLTILRNNATNIIDFTKDITETQVKVIREDVKNLALSTAKVEVEEAFLSNNITSLVEQKAENLVQERLEKLVSSELNNVKIVFDYIPKITSAYDQIRQGSRKHFDLLDTLAHFNEYEIVNEISRELLLQKGEDYYNSFYHPGLLFGGGKGPKRLDVDPYKSLKINKDFQHNSTPSIRINRMIDTITYSQELYNVTLGFIIIEDELKIGLKPFDMRLMRELKKKYKN